MLIMTCIGMNAQVGCSSQLWEIMHGDMADLYLHRAF